LNIIINKNKNKNDAPVKIPSKKCQKLDVQTCNSASRRYRRASQIDEQREARNEIERNRLNQNQQHRNLAFNPYRAAFNYIVKIDYSSQQIVAIGPMNVVCQYYKALRFKNEVPRLC